MATKSDFTTEEWKTIVAAPPMIGLAVACASLNGPWGVVKEMLSMGMAMAEMLQKGASNPLIADLAADLKNRQTKPESPPNLQDPEICTDIALKHIRAVNELLRTVKPKVTMRMILRSGCLRLENGSPNQPTKAAYSVSAVSASPKRKRMCCDKSPSPWVSQQADLSLAHFFSCTSLWRGEFSAMNYLPPTSPGNNLAAYSRFTASMSELS